MKHFFSQHGLLREAAFLTGSVLIVLLLLFQVYGGFISDFNKPLTSLNGDAIFVLEMFKQVESGHWISDQRLGAPFLSDWTEIPVQSWGHLLIVWLCIKLTSSVFAALNLCFLLFSALAVLCMYYAARKMGLSSLASSICGLFFALQPFVFFRFPNHFFLVGFFWVPLLILVAWQIASGTFFAGQVNTSWRQVLCGGMFWRAVMISLLAVIASGPYYAFYAGIIFIMATLYARFTHCDPRSFWLGGFLTAMIGLGLFLCLLPTFAYWQTHGRTHTIARRAAYESELYGLKFKHLLLPPTYHRLESLRAITARAEDKFPLENENATAKLGFFGVLGLFVLLACFFFRKKIPLPSAYPDTMHVLGLLLISLLFYCTIGGFSSLFATFVSPQLRGHSRVVVFIAALSLLSAAHLIDNLWYRSVTGSRRFWFGAVLLVLLILAVLDVLPPRQSETDRLQSINSILSQERFLQQIKSMFPKDGAFLQLPFIDFPEGPPTSSLEAYDHLWPRILSDDFRWSFGLLKRTGQSELIRQISELDPAKMAPFLKALGFAGIWLDTRGYGDGGKEMAAALTGYFGPAVAVREDGLISVFAIGEGPKEPVCAGVLVAYNQGWSKAEGTGEKAWRWMISPRADLMVFNADEKVRQIELYFLIKQYVSGGLQVFANGQLATSISETEKVANVGILLNPGINTVQFLSTNTHGFHSKNPKETREFYFSIINLQVRE